MNAVEIEEAVSDLARAPFDPATFPFDFLTAFGVKETTIARLRKGDTNASDVGGVLQRSNIHIAVAAPGGVNGTLRALRESPKTAAAKAKFILASDGDVFEAEDLTSGEALACSYDEFADHFGFFLPLAGISTVKEIKNNPIDVKATGRLNRLYVELLKENADWGTPERRHDLNQFMARLIFCFFAEDTGIFNGTNLFTSTVERMSNNERGSVEFVITELFRAMDTSPEQREDACLRSWADDFPYVNGGLFGGAKLCPQFSKVARSYLLRAGELNWQEINPDIFGSMIQAVADEGERGSLGMHYTSVPNIMKVLGPLFVDDLRAQLEAAGDNVRKLRNLRKRLANIQVFDPACGSGNFLVIAYIRMREIENEIVAKTNDDNKSVIKLSNFYGIELKSFAAEIAKLALLIAEFQCDVRFIDQKIARSLVLPLKSTGQITTGNALQIKWDDVCPDTREHKNLANEFNAVNDTVICGENRSHSITEIFICGNPPYLGKGKKSEAHQNDMQNVLEGRIEQWGYVDYVGCWFVLAADFCRHRNARAALVATNSLCQGRQLPQLWPVVLGSEIDIFFAHQSFKWKNNAAKNAGVMCVVIGLKKITEQCTKFLIDGEIKKQAANINAYLINGPNIYVESRSRPLKVDTPRMITGSVPNDGGNLIMSESEKQIIAAANPIVRNSIKRFMGSQDYLHGIERFCLDIKLENIKELSEIKEIAQRLDAVHTLRLNSPKKETREVLSKVPYRFQHIAAYPKRSSIIVPSVSSETREWFPVGYVDANSIVSNLAFFMPDAPIWCMSLIASKMHLVWLATVCGKLKNDYRYSNTLGWNTFPIPDMTQRDIDNLTASGENILLMRENGFPATVADMYEPLSMPLELREAHQRNDEIVEQVYIGRKFRNDTERLEKLFELYTKANVESPPSAAGKPKKARLGDTIRSS